jgi:Xaa-Pro dipeptidase
MDANRLRQEGWLKNVEGYGQTTMMEKVVERVKRLGLESARIGYESGSSAYLPEGFITHAEYQEMVNGLPNGNFVDSYKIMDELTLVKEEEEVRLMRQATAIVDCAHMELREVLKAGMSEKQVAGIAEKIMRDAGSEFAWTFTGGQEIASGYRTWTGGCTPATDKIIQPKEFVVMDLHGMYGLMLGDVSHNAVMGQPDNEQRKVIEAYVKTCEHIVMVMKPGNTLGQVARNCREFLMENGWDRLIRGFFGHGIGHFGHEWYPIVSGIKTPHTSEPDYVLEPNYIQIIALAANQPGVGGLRLEAPLLITETGNELLSKIPFDPWILER